MNSSYFQLRRERFQIPLFFLFTCSQWMIGKSKPASVYFGCVGNDSFSKELRKAAEESGVHLEYLVDPVAPTGTCAVVITDKHRSLVANLGAANCYKIDHLRRPEIWTYVEKAK